MRYTEPQNKLGQKRGDYQNLALFLFLGTFLWGSAFFCTKIVLKEYSPFQIIFLRTGIAFVVLQVVSFKNFIPPKMPAQTYLHFAILSFLMVYFPFLCINFASQVLTTGVTAILNSMTSLMTFTLAAYLGLAKGKLCAQHIVGIFLGIAGVICVVSPHDAFVFQGFWPESLMLLACLSYALASLYKDHFLATQHAFTTARYCVLFSLFFSSLFLWGRGERVTWPQAIDVGLALVWLGGACTALGYIIYFYLIKVWGPSRASTVSYVFPFSAYLLGVFALGEPILWGPLLGGGFIAGAVFLTRTYR